MTEPKDDHQINKGILGALGNFNQVTQNIYLQPGLPAPYMLPPEIRDFTGREDYIVQVEEKIGCCWMATIAGMPGVGKSALALRVAYRLKNRLEEPNFPDAQLYVNLYGQTPELALEPKTVLIRFLMALTGRNESELATDLEGLKAQYQTVLANKKALVILDNAKDEGQIRDLLPSNSNCAVVVTSRSPLTGLDGEAAIDLAPMEMGESELLFQAILANPQRVNGELPAVQEIVKLCGRLPMAIRIAAATLRQKIWVDRSLQVYARVLAEESTRLDKLRNDRVEKASPGQGCVRASFNLSYQALSVEEQQVFRWVAGLPGVDFGIPVLVAAMEHKESQLVSWLEQLLEAQMLELRGTDRFGWHDLMRLFAKEKLTKPEQEKALDRSLTWYCNWADFWENGLHPVRCRQLAQQLAKTEEELSREAIEWFAAEQENWVGIVRDLTQVSRPNDAIFLAANLVPFFSRWSRWSDWVTTHKIIERCANQSGDSAILAQTLNNLGNAYNNQSKWNEAINCYEKALEAYCQVGDYHGKIQAICNLGNVYNSQSKWDKAINCYKQSLELFRQVGDRYGEAQVLNNLGTVYNSQSEWDEAINCYEKSLKIRHQLGDRSGIAQALMNSGNVRSSQNKWDEAIDYYEKSLEIFRQVKDSHGMAQTLQNLGNACNNQNEWDKATGYCAQASEIYHKIEDHHGKAQTLGTLGLIRQNQGRWNEAIDCHRKSAEMYHQIGDDYHEALALGNIGCIYTDQGKLNEAIYCHQKSLDIFCRIGDSRNEGRTFSNIGSIYLKQGKLDEAVYYHRRSLDIFRQIGDSHSKAQTFTNLGNVLGDAENFFIAQKLVESEL
jgi:tetratricopeptide (TPR) repeat protein